MIHWLLLLSFFIPPPSLPTHPQVDQAPYVKGVLNNQLGNQMFEIATTLAHAWDNGAVAVFPDLLKDDKVSWWRFTTNHRYVFWRLNTNQPKRPATYVHIYDGMPYQEIPYMPDMDLSGGFQSEKYFAHHKDEILELFRPHETLVKYIQRKCPWLKGDKTVAVHVRCYWPNYPGGWPDGKGVLPSLPPEWFEKAMLQFPADHQFVIFSNNIPWCKQNLSHIKRKLLFVEGQPHFIDLFAMSMCKHNIISNSSFSWWSAYMNTNSNKMVIGPKRWFEEASGLDSSDIMPGDWIRL